MAHKSLEKGIKEKIRNWLMEDGWKLGQQTFPNSIWAFLAEDELGRRIIIGQNKGREDEIVIQGGVNITDDTNDRIKNLSEDKRNELLWDIRFELLKTNLEFSGVGIPLKRVEMVGRIFEDALTKDCFLQRTSEVRKGILVVLWILARRFAQQPPPRQLGFQR